MITGTRGYQVAAGTVTRAPQVRNVISKRTGESMDVADISISYGRGDNEFLKATVWNDRALVAASTLKKRDRVMLAGLVREDTYNGRTQLVMDCDCFIRESSEKPTVATMENVDISSADLPWETGQSAENSCDV